MRVALFVGCVTNVLFPTTAASTVCLLERLGVDVIVPDDQGCCGQMQLNSGYRDAGLARAAVTADVLERALTKADAVVVPSASCTATIRRGWAEAVSGDPAWHARVARLAGSVHELTEFLIDVVGVVDVGARFPHRVAYHPTCHSLREIGLGERPERLLSAVDGLELVDLPDADRCCGFGGLFSLKNTDVSAAMGDARLAAFAAAGAEVVVAADRSCLVHLQSLAEHRHTPLAFAHIADVLASTDGTLEGTL
jgi:L-lactate dehydrogenase complex protein LldE